MNWPMSDHKCSCLFIAPSRIRATRRLESLLRACVLRNHNAVVKTSSRFTMFAIDCWRRAYLRFGCGDHFLLALGRTHLIGQRTSAHRNICTLRDEATGDSGGLFAARPPKDECTMTRGEMGKCKSAVTNAEAAKRPLPNFQIS